MELEFLANLRQRSAFLDTGRLVCWRQPLPEHRLAIVTDDVLLPRGVGIHGPLGTMGEWARPGDTVRAHVLYAGGRFPPASYVPGVTMPSEVILTIGWNVLSHVELEPAHCGDETCEADHGYLGTITADDLTLRVSEAADGEEAVSQVLSFVTALSDATARTGS